MSAEIFYALGGTTLIVMGLYGFVSIPHLLRKLLAFNIMASGVFLVLVGLGQAQGEPDPVPQALVLTGIVVAFGSTALALVLLRRWFKISGTASLEAETATETEQDHRDDHSSGSKRDRA